MLEKAAKAYYEGKPIMSDDEFDVLAASVSYEEVGYKQEEGVEMDHIYPMSSLQKVFEGNSPPNGFNTAVVTPKLDGAAVSLGYFDGKLVVALTRGDGKRGRVITDKMRHLVNSTINSTGVTQITGEVVARKEVPNARNYAAGALNLKSEQEFLTRELKFIAYDVYPKKHKTWSECIEELPMDTVLDSNWDEYPHDGKVFRIDDVATFEGLGYTSHHPRGAYALKRIPEGVVTKLLDVIWQVGKSGVVSPVAILEPVMVGDATIKRATLHNMRYINELGLEIGCDVEIIRSGEIIPRVVRRV